MEGVELGQWSIHPQNGKQIIFSEVEAAGNISVITLTIPAGTKMPASTKAIVLVDVFPLHEEVLP